MTDTQEEALTLEVTKTGDSQKSDETRDVEMTNNIKEGMQFANCINSGECGNSERNSEDKRKKAAQLLLLGRRNIAIHDFQSAVGELAQCCELFKELYGELADEMGDPYYYYGKALLELARQETEVLGEAAQEGEENDDDDEEEEEEEEEEEKENCDKAGCSSEQSTAETKTETNNMSNGEVNEKIPDETTTESENDVVSDLQLSWQFLDLAKLIYKRKANDCKETAIKLTEVYLLLGENGLESENYSTAIDDMKEALALQSKVLPAEDRRIAETYYHLGVAHSLEKNFDAAITHFQSAIKQLEVKIASLEERRKVGDKKTEAEEKDAFYTMEGEIENIKSVIKDIQERITDMNDYKNQIKAELQFKLENCQAGAASSSVRSESQPGESSSSSSSSSKATGAHGSSTVPVSDISHLVRKKRKNENEEEHCIKKPKQENGI